jgi:hypothetical protein
MKIEAKLIDLGKNVLIILLLLSAVFLLLKVTLNEQPTLIDRVSRFLGGGTESSTALPDDAGAALAASPVYLVTTAENGSHYAVKYGSEEKKRMISQFSAYLGDVLGASGALNEITETQWRAALDGSGVFFDYLFPQPISAVASWLGAKAGAQVAVHTARRLLLGNENGDLALYFISADDGRFYRCKTTLSFSSLATRIADFPSNDAAFAFELGADYAALDPYFIFTYASGALRAVTPENPIRENYDTAALLKYFGMNSRTASPFSTGFVDGNRSLRLEPSGKLQFSTKDDSGLRIGENPALLTISESISACLSIVQNSVGLTAGEATIGLTYVSDAASPADCTLSFGYFVDGVPVLLPGGEDAARFEIRDGAIVRAELYFRRYTLPGGTLQALPEKQAVAIALVEGCEPVLSYKDLLDSVGWDWIKA